MANDESSKDLVVTGDTLVAEFLAALTNLTAVETAKFAANQSEQDAIMNIASATTGLYVNPEDIPAGAQENMVKASVDAHIKKVQAAQLASFSTSQLGQMELDAKDRYVGKKVVVEILQPEVQPIESYWFNNKTGEYTVGNIKSSSIKGIIEDLSLAQNTLLLRPTMGSRLLLPARKQYAVFVVNPMDLTPAVRITCI